MPNLERRVTALEVAMVERTADVAALKADMYGTDDRINAVADGLMEHRREVAARFDQVDSRLDRVDSRLDRVESDISELKGDVSQLKGDLIEVRDVLTRVAAKVGA